MEDPTEIKATIYYGVEHNNGPSAIIERADGRPIGTLELCILHQQIENDIRESTGMTYATFIEGMRQLMAEEG